MSTWPVFAGFVALSAAAQAAIVTRHLDLTTWAVCVGFGFLHALIGWAFMLEWRGPSDR